MAGADRSTRLQFLRPFTTRLFNPISRHFVHRLPGFAIVGYRGRTSGRSYRTPMNVFRRGDTYVFALTYGPDVQWVKNVLAAGEADLQVGSRHIPLRDPELFADPTRRLIPWPVRIVLRLMGVRWFLRMAAPPRREAETRTVPRWVPLFNRLSVPLLRAGVPMGPDVLLTVRGRTTGVPRTTPVSICENGDRRGVISPFGETQWVRNLRAAGTASITTGRRTERVRAVELSPDEAAAFIQDAIAPIAQRSRFGGWFVRAVDGIDVDDPVGSADGRPVFELFPA